MSDFDLTEGSIRSPAHRPADHEDGGGEHHDHPEHAAVLGLQRTAGNAATTSLVQRDPAELVQDTVSGGGQALPDATREKMESSFGQDFSDVRVHTGGQAGESAAAVQAHAYTVGNNMVFQDGQYAPGTSAGDRTLAHELTHVVQQREGPVDGNEGPGGLKVSDPSDRFERAAEANADTVSSGGGAQAGHSDAAGGSVQALAIQRQETPEEEKPEEEKEETPLQTLAIQRQETPEEEEA